MHAIFKIPIEYELLEDNKNKAILLKDKIKKLLESAENNDDLDFEDVYEESKELESQFKDFFSIYSVIPLLDTQTKRTDEYKYDVTKIYISESDYEKFKNLDREIIKIAYSDILNEKNIEKELSMLHFVFGFAVNKELDSGYIYLIDGYLKQKDVF